MPFRPNPNTALMKLKIAAILFVFTGCLTLASKAQHVPLQSQYMFNGVALNPAYTGSEEAFSIVGSYRAQWVGFKGAPTTQAITAHAPLKNTHSALGVQLFADQIGVDRTTGIFASYAYRLRFEKARLSLGISGGVNFLRSYFSQLDVADSQDQLLINDSPLGILPDFSFGAHYYTEQFFLSLSIPMFLTHTYTGSAFALSNDFSNYNVMLGGGMLIKLGNGSNLKPSTLLKYRSNAKIQADINLMAMINDAFDVGLSYRTQEALIGLVQYRPTQQLGIMYSFGMPLSPIAGYTHGSHEVSVKYNFLYKTQIEGPRFLGW